MINHNKQKNKFTIDFTIDYDKPVELKEFTDSLNGLSNQYVKFLKDAYKDERPFDAKLHVEKIKEGSIITQLVEYSSFAIPFLTDINTILEFGKFLKTGYDFFLTGKKDNSFEYDDIETLNNLKKIIQPGIHNKNKLHIDINGDNNNVFNIFGSDGTKNDELRVITEHIDNRKKELLNKDVSNIYSKQSFYFTQIKGDIKSKSGTYGKIDNILSSKEMKVIFEDDSDKEEMINGEQNPLNLFFIVDVEVQYVMDDPKVFKIIKLYEIIDNY